MEIALIFISKNNLELIIHHPLYQFLVLLVDMNPTAQCVKLVANAEIIVAPMVRNVNGAVKATDIQDLSTQLQKVVQCLRVLALDECSDELTEGLSEQGPFTVQVHPESWIEADLSSQPALRISKVIPPHAEKAMDDEARDPEDLLVGTSAIYVKVASSHRVPLGHVAISKQVQDALDAENYSIVTYVQ
jgi:peroxin-1